MPGRKILEEAGQGAIKWKKSVNGHSIALLKLEETTFLL
jgi:hypothetical protein